MQDTVPTDWYDGFFEGEWLDEIALARGEERTGAEGLFVRDALGLQPGERLLDLACGHGRISLALARAGVRVTGVDLSPRSLELARDSAAREGLEVDFVRSDMREIEFDGEFDAAINVFTSFGYFEDEAEDQRVLDAVGRALRPGGRFLIDVINLLGFGRRYQPRRWEETASGVVLTDGEYDFLRGRNSETWTFLKGDGSRTALVHSVRAYTPHELAQMLERAGLVVTASWGDWDGSPLSFDSRRLILRADKPA